MIRTLKLYVDIESGKLLDATTWYDRNDVPEVRRGDTVEFELNFKRLDTTNPRAYEDATLEDLGAFFVGVKAKNEFSESTYLAETETLTVDGAKLTFALSLVSAGLAGKLTGSTAKCESVLEVSYVDGDGEDTIASFRIDILNDYVKGTEGDPPPAVPTYYTAAQVEARLAALLNIAAGKRLVIDTDGNLSSEDAT